MISDKLLEHEIVKLNAHLPLKKISLKEAISSDRPHVNTRGGAAHYFKKDELKKISDVLPEGDWEKLQLPILIVFESKLGRGAARIMGGTESFVVRRLLDKKTSGELIIYRPEVAVLRQKLPTTTQYLFTP